MSHVCTGKTQITLDLDFRASIHVSTRILVLQENGWAIEGPKKEKGRIAYAILGVDFFKMRVPIREIVQRISLENLKKQIATEAYPGEADAARHVRPAQCHTGDPHKINNRLTRGIDACVRIIAQCDGGQGLHGESDDKRHRILGSSAAGPESGSTFMLLNAAGLA